MIWALEILKISTLIGSFCAKYITFDLKNVQRSYLTWHWRVMQNLERNWLDVSKLTWGICQILNWALESLKNFHFNGLLLIKVYTAWTEKVQRSYLSWQWRVMQNLERKLLAVSKLTWEIWNILARSTGSLTNLLYNGLFSTTVYVWATKSTEKLYLIALKTDAKCERKLTCTFKNDMRNLANFQRLKNSHLILWSKMGELNQNKNSKQAYRPDDAVWKLYLT